jgi:hypothetical protein
MDLEETAYDVVGWIYLAQDVFQNRALVYKMLNHLFPEEKGKFLKKSSGYSLLRAVGL